ncbi:MAG: hypothetical protein MAG551_01637 [Candidatus Scalindua arabica]|uniref:Histidine kinase n=1 Tax=Candidatus Scalindua arabica TaxID=1127984 RepID=A0A941W3G3_9BACT|nr:hypothetical protein [Candidatus Scalindua arabica]
MVDTEPVRRIIEDDNSGMTSIYPGYRGVPVVGASIDIPEYGWILLAEVDKAEAFAPLKLMRNIAVILGGVCSAAVVGVGIVFSLLTSRPINKLKDATDRLAAGEFKQKVAIKHNDEIGALANSFNTMAEEIKVLTESLERRIAERTQELSHTNEELLIEIYWRKRTEEELRKLSRAVEQSSSTIVITDINGDIEYVNPKFIQTTGYTFVEVIGQNPRILKSGKQAPEVYKELWGKIKSGKEWRGEFQNKKKNGELYWESASISSAKDEKGTITNYVAVKEDITERKKAEDQIKASLREKEVLLKEIHHRVKNNMQIISSLLNLQLESIEDENIRQILKESRNRVKSMALVHEKLYQTKDLSRIDFGEYMRSLTASLLRAFGVNTDRVQLVNDIDEVFLDVNKAIPCGLITNEIVSNSIKYAFSDSATGVIKVSMHKISDCGFRDLNPQSEIVELVISDNGVGLPEGLDFRHTKTLGMELVNTLVGQLDGSIEYVNINGAEFKITFGV